MSKSVPNVTPADLFRVVERLIDDGKKALAGGDMPDLMPVENGIAMLCSSLAGLPKEEARQHQKALEQVMAELTMLGQELQEQQKDVMSQLKESPLMRKANVAYRTSDSMGEGMYKSAPVKKTKKSDE